jgi:hypothetical protein
MWCLVEGLLSLTPGALILVTLAQSQPCTQMNSPT